MKTTLTAEEMFKVLKYQKIKSIKKNIINIIYLNETNENHCKLIMFNRYKTEKIQVSITEYFIENNKKIFIKQPTIDSNEVMAINKQIEELEVWW